MATCRQCGECVNICAIFAESRTHSPVTCGNICASTRVSSRLNCQLGVIYITFIYSLLTQVWSPSSVRRRTVAVSSPYAQISMTTYGSATLESARIIAWFVANVSLPDQSFISIALFIVASGVTNAMSVASVSTALTLWKIINVFILARSLMTVLSAQKRFVNAVIVISMCGHVIRIWMPTLVWWCKCRSSNWRRPQP